MKTKFNGILTLLLAFVVQLTFAQEKTISGTVVDETNMPLPGATVVIKGTTTGASTDFDGNYSINANTGDKLTFSYVGYADKTVTIGAESTIDMTMKIDSSLDEVVIVAYGSEKASNVTSAISVVKAESIEQVPNASIDQILQGQAAGLNIQTGTGQPGASGTILLRGRNSINGNSEPLFIIDGVPVNEDNFRSINANDIANISVLKDASASALYGNRAAGGVIIVTTKGGKLNSGTKVQYRSLYGQSSRIEPGFDLMNSQQYLTYARKRGFNSFSDAEINARAAQTNTNWSDILMDTGDTMSHEVNITSGGERTTSYSSLNYFKQEGITLRSDLTRFTVRNNVSSSSENNKFKFNSNVTLGYSVSNDAGGTGGSLDNTFINSYIGLPSLNPYNPDGSLNLTGDGSTGFANSPVVSLNTATLNTSSEEELKIVGKIGASYEIIKNITTGGSVGLDYEQINFLNITTPGSLRGLNNDTNNPTAALIKGAHAESYRRNANINVNYYATYKNVFNDKHSLEVSAFTEYFKRRIDTYGFEAFGLDPKLPGSGSGFTDGAVTEGPSTALLYNYVPSTFSQTVNGGIFSYFGIAKYDYDNKYGIQASLRRDASSRFNKTNKWGTFWSVSGKWNIHNEDFMSDVTFVNQLKLRASYGTTGNDRTGGDFDAFDQISTSPGTDGNYNGNTQGYQGTNGYWLTKLGNPDLKWETTTQSNIGIDFTLMNRRLSGTIDAYSKITSDLFLDQPISTLSGFDILSANVGELSNKGLELSLNYSIIKNDNPRDLQWSVNGNIAYNKNKIEKLTGDGLITSGWTALKEGEAYGSFNLVPWAGVNPANGAPLYLDLDGNITETYTEDNRRVSDKTSDPKYTGGFGTNVSYKGFSLNTLFTFAMEQYRINGSLGVVEDPTLASFANQSTSILREWENPGDITDIPHSSYGSTRNTRTDRYLEDASFLRLRNITLAYDLDKKFLKKTNFITGVRIYTQGQNLLTFTKWRGFDPESNLQSTFFEFPTPKTWTVGLDINF